MVPLKLDYAASYCLFTAGMLLKFGAMFTVNIFYLVIDCAVWCYVTPGLNAMSNIE